LLWTKVFFKDNSKDVFKSFEKNKVIIVEEKPTRDHLEVLWGNNHKLKELGFKPKLDSMQQILKELH